MRKEFILRIEFDVYEELKKVADMEDRSVNKQIEYIIKKYIEEKYNNNIEKEPITQ